MESMITALLVAFVFVFSGWVISSSFADKCKSQGRYTTILGKEITCSIEPQEDK